MSEEAGTEFCGEVIRYIKANDRTMRRDLDVIRGQEKERPDVMADFLVNVDPKKTA